MPCLNQLKPGNHFILSMVTASILDVLVGQQHSLPERLPWPCVRGVHKWLCRVGYGFMQGGRPTQTHTWRRGHYRCSYPWWCGYLGYNCWGKRSPWDLVQMQTAIFCWWCFVSLCNDGSGTFCNQMSVAISFSCRHTRSCWNKINYKKKLVLITKENLY